jgi:phosphate transport system permease protein
MPGSIEKGLNAFRLRKIFFNRVERVLFAGLVLLVILIPLAMGSGLFLSSWELFTQKSFVSVMFGTEWNPARGELSFLPFFTGTLWVTVLSVLFAFPFSLLVAIFLVEYAPVRLSAMMRPAIDVVSGLPSVIFGLWGVLLVVPFVGKIVAPVFGVSMAGYSILAAGLVLALMIMPIMVQVMTEIFTSVPMMLREAAFALGLTKWEVVKTVVLRKSLPGIIAATVLALARAFGETLAVLMVIGNVPQIPATPLSAGATFPTLIANSYGEMFSIPLYNRALMAAAFILFIVVVGFIIISTIILKRVKRGVE